LGDAFALAGLALAAFLAATPVPFNSELPFLTLQYAGWPAVALVVAASIGNVLGSCVTYAFGRGLGSLRDRPRFPVSPAAMARAEAWFARWGRWSLLLSWAPGGDLIVALAGAMRVPLPVFLALVMLAKTGRYVALAWAGAAAMAAL
jgi:membrane protein YqaA with SNARE-associated domain